MVDDFCQSQAQQESNRPGPQSALSVAEVVRLSLFGQWANFASERAFYRYAHGQLEIDGRDASAMTKKLVDVQTVYPHFRPSQEPTLLFLHR